MNLIQRSLWDRKSVRAFQERPIDAQDRRAILLSALQAPTAGNQLLYTILDITDEALKERLAYLCDHQPFIARAPMVLIFVADCQRWQDAYEIAGCDPRPPMAGDLMLAVVDAAVAAQNTVVCAHSLGIGSCYIGDILENCEQVRELLDLPLYAMPAVMVVYGHPTDQQRLREKPPRFDPRFIVQENAYRRLSPEEHREMYLERERAMGREHTDYDASVQAFYRRKYEAAFSREMSRSVQAYLEGFYPDDDGRF